MKEVPVLQGFKIKEICVIILSILSVYFYSDTITYTGRTQNGLSHCDISHIVKCIISMKNLLLYSQAQIRQIEGIVMMSQEGSTKNCKFHDSQSMDSCARTWSNESYSENALFLQESSSLHSGIDQTNGELRNYDQGRDYLN